MNNKYNLRKVLETLGKFGSDDSFERKCEMSEIILEYLKNPNSEPLNNPLDVRKLYEIAIFSLNTIFYKVGLKINLLTIFSLLQ